MFGVMYGARPRRFVVNQSHYARGLGPAPDIGSSVGMGTMVPFHRADDPPPRSADQIVFDSLGIDFASLEAQFVASFHGRTFHIDETFVDLARRAARLRDWLVSAGIVIEKPVEAKDPPPPTPWRHLSEGTKARVVLGRSFWWWVFSDD